MQLNKRARFGAAALLTCLTALSLAACSGSSADPAPKLTSGLDLTAHVDPATATISFPSDRYVNLPMEDQVYLSTARDITAQYCIRSKGVKFWPLPTFWAPEDNESNFFGVWTDQVAQRFAFVTPMSPGDMAANGVTVNGSVPAVAKSSGPWRNNADLSDPATAKIVNSCRDGVKAKQFNPGQFVIKGPWNKPLAAADESAPKDPQYKKALKDYDSCLKKEGLTPGSDHLSVKGEDSNTIDPEQIKLALQVVSCKSKTHLVQRLSDDIAAKEAPIIDKYASELTANEDKLNARVAEAKKIVSSYNFDAQ